MKPKTVEELKQIGFIVPDMGMEIRLKKKHIKNYFSSSIGFVEHEFIFRKMYGIENGRVVFYTNGNGYMLPYFNGIEEILDSEGYEKTNVVQLFFEKDEIPVDDNLAKQWKQLEKKVAEFDKNQDEHKKLLEEVKEKLHICKKCEDL